MGYPQETPRIKKSLQDLRRWNPFHPTVTVKTKIDTELLNINSSQVRIRKVLMNLVSNASEAIEGGGNVTISTMNRYFDTPLRGYDHINIGEYAVLDMTNYPAAKFRLSPMG